MPDLQQKYYDTVAEELAQQVLKPGVWARAMAEVGTDDARARAAYIRLRVTELLEEDRQAPSISSRPVVLPLPPKGPKGVGGWITFFCVGLTIFSPLFSLIKIVYSYGKAAPVFSQFPVLKNALLVENLGVLIFLIYGLIVGVRIWRGSEKGRNLARNYLKDRFWCILIFEFIVYWMISGLPSEVTKPAIEAIVVVCVRELIYFSIWWNYFKRSQRVRNTYGNE